MHKLQLKDTISKRINTHQASTKSMMPLVTFLDIQSAEKRINPYVSHTPILQSQLLNKWLGHSIVFKAECLQKTGSFKLRGALNMMLRAKEEGRLGNQVVANSSGNHAQAVAYAANILGVKATIYSPNNVSKVKAAATQFYGAELKLCSNRREADEKAKEMADQDSVMWIPPFNHQDIIAGQGTAAYEALNQVNHVNAVFAPVGGGGLISGTLISTRTKSPQSVVVGAEPLVANDAAQSLKMGSIQHLKEQPDTLADGAATQAVGEKTFPHLQALDEFYEVSEQSIAYWTQWLQHILKIHVEPTSAMCMGAVIKWLKKQNTEKKVLVMLSGGNIDQQKILSVWKENHLEQVPSLSVE